jgi:hypothetical protein
VHEESGGLPRDELLPDSETLGGVSLPCMGRDRSFGSPLSCWSVARSGSRPLERDVKKLCIGTGNVVQVDNGNEPPTHHQAREEEDKAVIAYKLQRRV